MEAYFYFRAVLSVTFSWLAHKLSPSTFPNPLDPSPLRWTIEMIDLSEPAKENLLRYQAEVAEIARDN